MQLSFPPTPTPLPPPQMQLSFPDVGLDTWGVAPQAVGMWNQLSYFAPGVQAGLLLAVVVIGIFFIVRLFRSLGKDE